jgi:ribosomal protein L3 glutamine methyltransferase
MKLLDCIQAQAERLQGAGVAFGHGTTNAFDEAVWLVLWRLGLPLDELDSVANRELAAEELERIQTLVQQRIDTRKPAAYLTNEAWLQGLPFYVDERVVIPRSLLAEALADGAIDDAFEAAHEGRSPLHVLDLCTGNGSLAVLAALAWPDARVTATDISTDALAVAAINLERHRVGQRVDLIEGDGVSGLEGALSHDDGFDVVLCNPPYVNAQSMTTLPPEYRAEPSLALDGNRNGGADGMDFLRAHLPKLARHMSPKGVLALEVGHERAHFEAAFPALAGAGSLWVPTSGGDDAVVIIEAYTLALLT